MKLGSVFTLLEEVERQYIHTGKPIDPKLREAYDEVKREADACLKATLERPTAEEVMAQHRHERLMFIVVVGGLMVPFALYFVALALGWLK